MMATTETTEQSTTKIQIGAKIDPAVYAAIGQLATEEERSFSNMVERLLKQSPQLKEILEAEVATV